MRQIFNHDTQQITETPDYLKFPVWILNKGNFRPDNMKIP